jgi:hypothetical protein
MEMSLEVKDDESRMLAIAACYIGSTAIKHHTRRPILL